jgi:putative endonuclease
MKHVAYIVCCRDGTYYTGYTNDLDKRMELHNQGKGAKYTSGRTPVTLIYSEEFPTKSEAMRREHAIKQFTRPQKECLIKQHEQQNTQE